MHLSVLTKIYRDRDDPAFLEKPRCSYDFEITEQQFLANVTSRDVERATWTEMQTLSSTERVLCDTHPVSTKQIADCIFLDADAITSPVDADRIIIPDMRDMVTNEQTRLPLLHVPVGCNIQFFDAEWDPVTVSVLWNGHTMCVIPVSHSMTHILRLCPMKQKCLLEDVDASTENSVMVQWTDLSDYRITRIFEGMHVQVAPASGVKCVQWILRPSTDAPPIDAIAVPRQREYLHFHSIDTVGQPVDLEWPPGGATDVSATFDLSDVSTQSGIYNHSVTGLSAVLRWDDGTMPSTQDVNRMVRTISMNWGGLECDVPFAIKTDKDKNPIVHVQLASYANFRWAMNVDTSSICKVSVHMDGTADVQNMEHPQNLRVILYMHRICAVRCVGVNFFG